MGPPLTAPCGDADWSSLSLAAPLPSSAACTSLAVPSGWKRTQGTLGHHDPALCQRTQPCSEGARGLTTSKL